MSPRVLLVLATLSAAAFAQTNIGGISFVDRANSGDVVLGNHHGALCVLDYDDDGWLDLIIGEQEGFPTRLLRNVPDPGRPGNREYQDVTATSGLADSDGIQRSSWGIVSADYDNDGDADVYMTGARLGVPNTSGLLYRNDGGTFTNVTTTAGLRISGYEASSASWNDYDLDGHVDLLVCCWQSSPSNFILYRNIGDGTFSNVSTLLPTFSPTFRTVYGMVWVDYDEDGWADCFVLSDMAPAILLKNVDDGFGGRHFIDAAATAGFTNIGMFPMGIAAGDYDGDGDFDIGLSNIAAGAYYRNDGGTMTQVTPFASIWGWGVAWIDVENDGDLDFYMAGSWDGARGSNHDKLFRNLGNAAFDDVSGALNSTLSSSRYSVQMDFNEDGLMDLITVNPGFPGQFVSVYENESTSANHWFKVKLEGDGRTMNRDAIGAVVRIKAGAVTQVRQVVSGSSTSATEDVRASFGLGAATAVDRIEVVWPRAGSVGARTEIFVGPWAADQVVTLTPSCRRIGLYRQGGCGGPGPILPILGR